MKGFFQRKKILLASIGGSLLTLIALVSVFFMAPTMVSASSGQLAATPTTTSTKAKVNYCNQYEQALAKKLNVSTTTLQQDKKSALITVINQRVKDGKLTQAKANTVIQKINSSAGNVCPSPLARRYRRGYVWLNKYSQNVINLLAQGLHLNASQLTAQFKAGKNLAEIAKTQNVSTSSLQTLVENTATTIIKQAVSAGTLKQTRANILMTNLQKHPLVIQRLEAAVVKKASVN